MAPALPLRAALERGALVTAANWPIVLIEFAIESLFKFAVAIPIVGGAFMVAVLVGADVRSLFDDGVQIAADRVVGFLSTAPVALGCFLLAVVVVAAGAALLMFKVKAGTLFVLVSGERAAPDLYGPLRFEWFRRASSYDVVALLRGIDTFGRRAMALGACLAVSYVCVALGYVLSLSGIFRWTSAGEGAAASFWPVLVVLLTSTTVVVLVGVNVIYDVLRIIVVMDDCSVRKAVGRLREFLVQDARQVIGILAVMGGVTLLATAVALLATAGLAFVAWVPVVGWVFLPLQAAAWLIRGLVFQHMGLMTIAAYQTQYRRFSSAVAEARPAPQLRAQGA